MDSWITITRSLNSGLVSLWKKQSLVSLFLLPLHINHISPQSEPDREALQRKSKSRFWQQDLISKDQRSMSKRKLNFGSRQNQGQGHADLIGIIQLNWLFGADRLEKLLRTWASGLSWTLTSIWQLMIVTWSNKAALAAQLWPLVKL